jgi:hypothetical protein
VKLAFPLLHHRGFFVYSRLRWVAPRTSRSSQFGMNAFFLRFIIIYSLISEHSWSVLKAL